MAATCIVCTCRCQWAHHRALLPVGWYAPADALCGELAQSAWGGAAMSVPATALGSVGLPCAHQPGGMHGLATVQVAALFGGGSVACPRGDYCCNRCHLVWSLVVWSAACMRSLPKHRCWQSPSDQAGWQDSCACFVLHACPVLLAPAGNVRPALSAGYPQSHAVMGGAPIAGCQGSSKHARNARTAAVAWPALLAQTSKFQLWAV